jgi:hypothetical protein
LLLNAENAENERRGRREEKVYGENPKFLRDLSVFLRVLRVESVKA